MFNKPAVYDDSFKGDLINALLLRPPYRKPKKVEDDKNFYGGDKTIHQTGHVDVQLNKHGQVVAVWFRCQMLPFKESREYTRDSEPQHVEGSIKGVVFEDE